jgi:hypothetical protein
MQRKKVVRPARSKLQSAILSLFMFLVNFECTFFNLVMDIYTHLPIILCVSNCFWTWCVHCACLQCFAGLNQNTPLESWGISLLCVGDLYFFWLGVPNPRACGASTTSENLAPGFWSVSLCIVCIFCVFLLFFVELRLLNTSTTPFCRGLVGFVE